jgi:hypothetical protein
MSRRPKSGRPIRKPEILQNADEQVIMFTVGSFLAHKTFMHSERYLRKHFPVNQPFTKIQQILLSQVYRCWVQGRGVNRKWQRYLNRLAHEMDAFFRNAGAAAVLLLSMTIWELSSQRVNECSHETKEWLLKSSLIDGNFCEYPRKYYSPQNMLNEFIKHAVTLGNRLNIFQDDEMQKLVRQLLTEAISKLLSDGGFKPPTLEVALSLQVPSCYEPSTGRFTFHDLFCVQLSPPETQKK